MTQNATGETAFDIFRAENTKAGQHEFGDRLRNMTSNVSRVFQRDFSLYREERSSNPLSRKYRISRPYKIVRVT